MRLKILFTGVDLKPSNKVLLPIPEAIQTIFDLTVYLRETFGLPVDVIERISLSLDGFDLLEDSLMRDVLSQDDLVSASCLLVCKTLDSVVKTEPKTLNPPVQIPFSIGDTIRFIEEPAGYDRMNLTVETVAVVEGVDTALWGDQDPVIVFKDAQGSWDTLRLCKMTNLEVVSKPKTEANHHVPKTEPKHVEHQTDMNGVAWRKRQRSKSIGALRRQIEWFVKTEGPLTLEDISSRSRVTDITEDEDDIREAIDCSNFLKMVDQEIMMNNMVQCTPDIVGETLHPSLSDMVDSVLQFDDQALQCTSDIGDQALQCTSDIGDQALQCTSDTGHQALQADREIVALS